MSLDERYKRVLARSGVVDHTRGSLRLAKEEETREEKESPEPSNWSLSDLKGFLINTMKFTEEKVQDFTREEANALFDKYNRETEEGKHVPPGDTVTPECKKDIKEVAEAEVAVSDKVAAQIRKLEETKEALKEQLDEARQSLDELEDQTEEIEESPASSPSRESLVKRESIADEYADTIDVLRSSIDTINSTIKGLKSTNSLMGDSPFPSFPDDEDTFTLSPSSSFDDVKDEYDLLNSEGEFDDLEGYNEELEGLLAKKKDILDALDRWASSLASATKKLYAAMDKRASLVRRLSLSSRSSLSTPSDLSELDNKIAGISSLIGRINHARIRLERDLKSVILDIASLLGTWSFSIESLMPDPKDLANSKLEEARESKKEVELSSPNSLLVKSNSTLFDNVSHSYSTFVYHSLAPQIPSDGKLDEKVAGLANKVITLSEKMADLASGFSYNIVHRSTLRLMPGLYYMIAHSLLGGIGREPDSIVQASAEVTALCKDLEEAGLVKEAGILRDSFDFMHTKGKDLISKSKDIVDRYRFLKEDTGNRRLTPKEIEVKKQRYYAQMRKVLQELERQISDLKKLEEKYKKEGDPEGKAPSSKDITALVYQRDYLRKEMEEVEKETGGFPASSKSLPQIAQVVISSTSSSLEEALTKGIPQSPKLEVEVLRLAHKISKLAQEFPKLSGKSRTLKEYPMFHSAMMALHVMFVGLEDILTASLRRT